VVQKRPILGNTDERIRAAREGGGDVSRANQVKRIERLGSALTELQFAEAEQREPVRVRLTGHQLAWALALTFDAAAAREAAMVQEEAQQIQVWRAQMAAQREVVA
jgi:hypothetical protein